MSFVQKYAPQRLQDVVISSRYTRDALADWMDEIASHEPLLLYGPNGTGKTSIATLIPKAIDPNFDANDLKLFQPEKGGDNKPLIGQVANFLSTLAFSAGSERYAIFDEVNYLTAGQQKALAQVINCHQGVGTVIMTTNDLLEVDKALRSRAECLEISHPTMDAWLPKYHGILADHGLAGSLTDQDLLTIAARGQGDCRKALRSLQKMIRRLQNGTGPVNQGGQVIQMPQRTTSNSEGASDD